MHSGSVTRSVTVFRDGGFFTEERELAEEVIYRIEADGLPAGRLSCSPWGIRQATIGSLFMQGVIRSAGEITSLDICADDCVVRVTTQRSTPCHGNITASSTTVSPSEIMAYARLLEERSLTFRRTGGVHCAAFAKNGTFLAYEEDVSRHAAIDKLAGSCLEQQIVMDAGILVFSGRVPGEIVCKAEKMGCRMIVALSAPTDHACRLAEDKGITLIGFAREDSFNVYSCPGGISHP